MLATGEANQVQSVESRDAPRPPAAMPRRAVPLTFSPIINDEANILAAIARGDRTLPDLAEEHATTVTALCLWLQREDIQRKLADLTTAGTTLTRIAAVNQLPKAVSALSFQIDGYIFDRTHNLIKPGLDADRIAATRDANVRKAAHLLLRLAKFDPNQPVYRRRERGSADSSTLAPRIADRTDLGEARSPAGGADGGAVERRETKGVLVLSTAPSPLPDIPDLCFSTLAAIAPESSRNPEPQTRSPIPTLTSHIPSPTSDFDERSAASTSPKGEVPAQPGVGAPAFSPGFASAFPTSSSSCLCHIPFPTSDFDERSAASTSPRGEVPAQRAVGAPAFPTDFAPAFPTSSSSCLSVFTSQVPSPTSDFEPEPSPPDSS